MAVFHTQPQQTSTRRQCFCHCCNFRYACDPRCHRRRQKCMIDDRVQLPIRPRNDPVHTFQERRLWNCVSCPTHAGRCDRSAAQMLLMHRTSLRMGFAVGHLHNNARQTWTTDYRLKSRSLSLAPSQCPHVGFHTDALSGCNTSHAILTVRWPETAYQCHELRSFAPGPM